MSLDRDVMPVRYAETARSPLAFNRGSGVIMAADLAHGQVSGLRAQLCGDAHVSNFGLFSNPAGKPVFDIADFDETLPGPWEWDVKRLAVSLEVAARQATGTTTPRGHVVRKSVDAYASAMRRYARTPYLEVLYGRVPSPHIDLPASGGGFEPLDRRAKGGPRLLTKPPRFHRIDDLMPSDEAALVFGQTRVDVDSYKRTLADDRKAMLDRYELRDIASELADIPAMGLRTHVLLMVETETAQPLLLQLREARHAIFEPFAGRSRYSQAGHRVIEGMRLISSRADVLLGWMRGQSTEGTMRDYYVRQWPRPANLPNLDRITMTELRALGQACATLLARAHAVSGDRVAIARYLGSSTAFTDAVETFASAYADQNLRDYESFLSAVDRGRIIVRRAA
jgi:uncharacterized protein (DUF2252 family)